VSEPVYFIRYDIKARKVGCVLLQCIGGTLPSRLFHEFFGDTNSWTLDPTNLKLYSITEAQLPLLAVQTDFTGE